MSKSADPSPAMPASVPVLLLAGSDDRRAPPTDAAALCERAGDHANLTVIEGAGHFEIIAPGTQAWPTVEKAVLSLIEPARVR